MHAQPKPRNGFSPPQALGALEGVGDIASLRMFRLVVELGSFSAAAERLSVRPGTISKHMTALEQKLGARLINRTTRKLQVTEAGEMLYGPCVRILEELEHVRDEFSQLRGQPAGALHVSSPTVLGLRYLAPALPGFLRAYPDITLDLLLTASKVDFLAQGVDIAIRFGEQIEPNLVCIPLARSTNVIAGSPAYFARFGTPRTPADLARHNCLLIHNLTAAVDWPVGAEQRVKVRGNLVANNGEVTRQAAIDGLGITTLPSFLIEADLQDKRLVAVLPEYAQESGIHAVVPVRRHMPGKVRAFIDFLKSILGPQVALP